MFLSRQRMTKQRIDEDRRAYERRQNPKGERRQFAPQRQIWPVIHIKGCNHQDVGHGHSAHVDTRPKLPKLSPRRPADRRGDERQKPQNEQVIVLAPPREREDRHRDENDSERQIIDRSGLGMTARLLPAQHRDSTGCDRCRAGHYMHGNKRQKERSIRRKRNAANDGRICDQPDFFRSRLVSLTILTLLPRPAQQARPLSVSDYPAAATFAGATLNASLP